MQPYIIPFIAFFSLVLFDFEDVSARSSRTGTYVSGYSNSSSVSVRGYTRKDGTYVQPHYRSAPDGDASNNYSHVGNTNPFTGKTGTNRDSGHGSLGSSPVTANGGHQSYLSRSQTGEGSLVSDDYESSARRRAISTKMSNFARCDGNDGKSWYTNGACRDRFNLML